MTSGSSKAVMFTFSDVADAFEFASSGQPHENEAYLALETGEVHFVSEMAGIDDRPEPDGDYVALPHKNDLDLGRALVFSFIEQELPAEWDTVHDYFRRRGAYGRLKHLLQSRGLLERWFAFETSATEQALRVWCQENDIPLSEG